MIICFVLNWCCCNYYESVGKTDGANFLFLSVYFVIGGNLYLYKDYIQEKVSRIRYICGTAGNSCYNNDMVFDSSK